MHDTNKYILISIYIPAIKDSKKVLCRIYREIYLVNNLKAYMLLSNDIIDSKKIILNIVQGKVYIDSYRAIAIITSRQRDLYQRRIIYIRKALIIAPRADTLMPIITL